MKTKEEHREHRIQDRMTKCVHFTGVQNKTCKAGVQYEATGHEGPLPCISFGACAKSPWHCELKRLYTREEAEAEVGESDNRLAMTLSGLSAARADADSKGLKKGCGGA